MQGQRRRRPVCVLSVGRSGSSLATRVLGMLGVDLGPEDAMLEADDSNPAGYWELKAVNDLNDEILTTLGGSLWDPPSTPPGWECRPELSELRERAARTVSGLFADHARWGFKDTRTLYTLPLWQDVIGPMDYIICVRHPAEVVESLRLMLPDRTPGELYARWLHGNCVAVRSTSGDRRHFVFYEDWSSDPMRVARDLNAFLAGANAPLGLNAQEEIRAFFDHRLHRRRADPAALASPEVPVEAASLYLLLRNLAAAEASGAKEAASLRTVAARLDSGTRLETMLDGERAERRALDSRLAELERERTALLADREWLRGQLASVQAAHDKAAAALTSAHEALAQVHGEADHARRALAEVEGSTSWRLTAPLRAARQRLRGD